jgi:dTDP-4-amino-4,6-dideoxygalactose transaminase
VLKDRVKRRRYIHDYYKENLSSLKEIHFLEDLPGFYSNRWLTTIVLSKNSVINREDIRLSLLKENIESRPLWKPMHLQPIFKKYQAYVTGIGEDLFNRGLCLPSGSNMDIIDLKRVVNIRNLYEI